MRKELPGTSIYLEVDYSSQMNRDLGAGDLDLAILFTPHYLPDLHYERIGDVHYEMVSNKVSRIEDVKPEDYIQAVYSPAFDRLHRQAHPTLSTAPIASGETTAILALMQKLGGFPGQGPIPQAVPVPPPPPAGDPGTPDGGRPPADGDKPVEKKADAPDKKPDEKKPDEKKPDEKR